MPMWREYRCEECGQLLVVKDVELSGRITCGDRSTHQRLAELRRGRMADADHATRRAVAESPGHHPT